MLQKCHQGCNHQIVCLRSCCFFIPAVGNNQSSAWDMNGCHCVGCLETTVAGETYCPNGGGWPQIRINNFNTKCLLSLILVFVLLFYERAPLVSQAWEEAAPGFNLRLPGKHWQEFKVKFERTPKPQLQYQRGRLCRGCWSGFSGFARLPSRQVG